MKRYKQKYVEVNIDPKYKKIFQDYAEEIYKNLINDFGKEKIKKMKDTYLQGTITKIIQKMGLDETNPNYKDIKKYIPKHYDKTLINNGDGNTYDSIWHSMNDNQQFIIVKNAIKKVEK